MTTTETTIEILAKLKAIGVQIQAENPTGNHGMELGLRSFTSSRLAEGGVARVVLLLYGIALLLSLLAFVNFAALTFLRLLTRRRELAIRLSLGLYSRRIASRVRLRQS